MATSGGLDKRNFNGMVGVDAWLERVEKQMELRKGRQHARDARDDF